MPGPRQNAFNDVGSVGSPVDTNTATVATEAGSLLIAAISAYSSGATANAITSLTDSASNTWTFTTSSNNQNPPAAGDFYSGGGYYGFSALGYVLNASAVSSITAVLSQACFDFRLTIYEFTDTRTGIGLDGASALASNATFTTYSASSVAGTWPSDMMVAVAAVDLGFTGANAPWNYQGEDLVSAWVIPASAGAQSCQFTGVEGGGTSQYVLNSCAISFGVANPSGLVFRCWEQGGGDTNLGGAGGETFGMEFSLTEACPLTGIWWYSPATVTALPSQCGIYDVTTQVYVSGTENTSPTWSGAAGSGWVKCSYDGSVTLLANHNYKVSVAGNPGVNWYALTSEYWFSGPGAGGWYSGPITAFKNANTDVGQDSSVSAFSYPNTSFNASNYWLDVEVTPPASGAALTAPGVILAAPVPAVSADGTVALTAPSLALAAPLVAPKSNAVVIALISPNLVLAAGALTLPGGAPGRFRPWPFSNWPISDWGRFRPWPTNAD